MNPQFGSGTALLGLQGGQNPLAQAMQRRGIDVSALQQQTPGSAGFDPTTGQAIQGGAPPLISPQPQAQPQGQPQGQSQQAGLPPAQGSAEENIVLGALTKWLTDNSSMKKKVIEAHTQNVPNNMVNPSGI